MSCRPVTFHGQEDIVERDRRGVEILCGGCSNISVNRAREDVANTVTDTVPSTVAVACTDPDRDSDFAVAVRCGRGVGFGWMQHCHFFYWFAVASKLLLGARVTGWLLLFD